jgi:serine O-acetyltransferase
MITTKNDLLFYLEQDRRALKIKEPSLKLWLRQMFWPDEVWRFERLLRYTEYYSNRSGGSFFLFRLWYKWRFKLQSMKLGFSIPINVFGPGLSIAHYGTIVVNSQSRVGANCRLHVGVNIGSSAGGANAPQLGDNCYIGPGAIIFGDIKIADNVTIGANATVNRSCSQERVVLAGSPAKIVKENARTWVEFNHVDVLQNNKKNE